ncbi:WD40 repeat-like-containing domain protein [Akanthomyces lecanii RCEF 1005]|uniref:WD40 repeat-like-containing domain protein n=1 Tax=Akanthomyces lecanii RCEF 1005 TaxID=1081108 RepID=A0A168HC26_CORDF|nr:WD40 repeat-like-containing domain protein [Akanthomyces lecanii RCEF 1005]
MAFPSQPLAHLTGSNGPIHAVTYSASPGTYILTGSADRTIRLYNPQPSSSAPRTAAEASLASSSSLPQGRLIQSYEAHGYEVLSLAVAASNQAFVSGGGDRAVFLWDVPTATTTRRFGGSSSHGHTSRVNCVAYAGETDNVVVSGGFDTTVRLWDARSGSAKPIQVLDEARDSITCLAVRGPEVVAGSVDGRVRSYDVRMGTCTTDVVGGRSGVTSVALTRDGRAMLVGSLDSKLRLMDRDDGTCLRAYADGGWRNEELRLQSMLGAREKYVLVGDEMTAVEEEARPGEGRVLAWDLLSGRLAGKVAVPWGPEGYEARKRVVGRDGKEKARKNVISCMAWKEDGWGDQFCVGGTSGVVTVFAA